MTSDPGSKLPGGTRPDPPGPSIEPSRAEYAPQLTRAGAVWAAVAAALFLLVLLIVFILQNTVHVQLHYFGLAGSLPLGMALLIASVGGGIVVAVAGGARMTQLRRSARRTMHQKAPRTDDGPSLGSAVDRRAK